MYKVAKVCPDIDRIDSARRHAFSSTCSRQVHIFNLHILSLNSFTLEEFKLNLFGWRDELHRKLNTQAEEAALLSHLSSLQTRPPSALGRENEEVNKPAKPRCRRCSHAITPAFHSHPALSLRFERQRTERERGGAAKGNNRSAPVHSLPSLRVTIDYVHIKLWTQSRPPSEPLIDPPLLKALADRDPPPGSPLTLPLFHLCHHFAADKSSSFLRCDDFFFFSRRINAGDYGVIDSRIWALFHPLRF